MKYYLSRRVDLAFDEAVTRVTEALRTEGFGILTDIDVEATLKKKLNINFRRYRILGACNPPFAYQALQLEDKIGALMPCNVVVQETPDGGVEVAAVDPVVSMSSVDNARLGEIAQIVRSKLKQVIDLL